MLIVVSSEIGVSGAFAFLVAAVSIRQQLAMTQMKPVGFPLFLFSCLLKKK